MISENQQISEKHRVDAQSLRKFEDSWAEFGEHTALSGQTAEDALGLGGDEL